MSTITVPLALAILSRISSDLSPLNHPAVPARGQERKVQDRDAAKFLDALASFLPTKPQSGQVYAISLAFVGNEEARICVAANRKEDFLDGDVHAPVKTIESIWAVLQHLTAPSSLDLPVSDLRLDLVNIVFSTHWFQMKARFEKRAFLCDEFFNQLPSDISSAEHLEPKHKELLMAAKDLFIRSKDVFRNPLPQAQDELFGQYHIACFRANEAISRAKKGILTMAWLRNLEAQLENSLKAKRDENQEQREEETRLTRFDFLRYIDKLVSPSRHIVTLCKIANHPSFADISKLPLKVQPIYPDLPGGPSFIECPTQTNLRAYLEDAYDGTRGSDLLDDDVRSQVLEQNSKTIIDKWSNSRPGGKQRIAVQPPHCECLLLRHHCTSKENNPYSYFGVSKLSCLQCGLFFQAYRQHAKTRNSLVEYQTAGCHAEVVPCDLPGSLGATDIDEAIQSHMLDSIKQVIGTILMKDAADLRQRKLSQSTAASSGDDDDAKYVVLTKKGQLIV